MGKAPDIETGPEPLKVGFVDPYGPGKVSLESENKC